MRKKIWIVNNLLLIAALILSGCGGLAASKKEKVPLRVEWTIWEGDYTLLVAQEKGFFERHGVKVEPVFYETFSSVFPDMASRRVDAGLFAVGDLVLAATVVDATAVAVYDSGGSSTVVSRAEIVSVADLRGKTLGVVPGTYGELFVREMLETAGMTIRDVTLVSIEPELLVDRLGTDLDAGYVWAPYDQEALKKGHKILYSRGAVGSLFPDVIVFRSDVVKDRPEDVRAFLNAWFEALEYRLANPDEANQMIARITQKPVEEVAPTGNVQLYSRDDNLKLFNKNSPPETSIYYSAQVNLDFFITSGIVTTPLDLEKLLDPSFVQ
jgi:NitT/TauT family transport system substrate-binding protein